MKNLSDSVGIRPIVKPTAEDCASALSNSHAFVGKVASGRLHRSPACAPVFPVRRVHPMVVILSGRRVSLAEDLATQYLSQSLVSFSVCFFLRLLKEAMNYRSDRLVVNLWISHGTAISPDFFPFPPFRP